MAEVNEDQTLGEEVLGSHQSSIWNKAKRFYDMDNNTVGLDV